MAKKPKKSEVKVSKVQVWVKPRSLTMIDHAWMSKLTRRHRALCVGSMEREFMVDCIAAAIACKGKLDNNERLQAYCDMVWPLAFPGLPPYLSDFFLNAMRDVATRRAVALKKAKPSNLKEPKHA